MLTNQTAHKFGITRLRLLSRSCLVVLMAMLLVWSSLPSVVNAADGDLDTTFDTDGLQTTALTGPSDFGNAVAIQQDGKIVVAGRGGFPAFEFSTNSDFGVARYNTDGSLDTSFDTDGVVVTNVSDDDEAYGVAIQQDGKIVIAGRTGIRRGLIGVPGGPVSFGVLRYNTDGSLDTTFDGDGIVTTDINGNTISEAYSVAIQADGKIVVAGYTSSMGTGRDYAVARYNTDGSLDTTFDTDGMVATNLPAGNDVARGVAIQQDSKIVAVGITTADIGVVRYNTNGSLDTTFDTDGIVTTDINGSDQGRGVVIQPDSKIVVVGSSNTTDGFNGTLAVVRYNTDGSLDTSFDTDGKVETDLGGAGTRRDFGYAVALQQDGKIVAAGSAQLSTFETDFGLARYNTDGSLDTSFGGDGIVTTDFKTGTNNLDEAQGVAIQADGKIVAVGYGVPQTEVVFRVAVARYESSICELTCPVDITVSNDPGQCGATVMFAPTDNGNCGTVTCAPASGSFFPVGATTVTCTPDTGTGCSFTVTVNDTEAPAVSCPPAITVGNDTGNCSAVVTFNVFATDNCDGSVKANCAPASGSTFPIGTTTVNCSATDMAGNTGNCSLTVTVNDTEDPFIICPDDITVTTPGPGVTSVVVNYTTPSEGGGTAGDNCGVASVVCVPPSGSSFPLGVSTVTCTVTDTSGNTAACSFSISTFDVCIEDDTNPNNVLLFISTGPSKGAYQICCGGTTLAGVGSIGNKGGTISLVHFTSTRRVQGYLFLSQTRGSAALQSPVTAFPCAINDSNTSNNINCSCENE